MKRAILTSTALLTIFGTTPAFAQTPEAAEDDGDIVVTGQKRTERYLDAPVSVQVFGEEQIAQAGIRKPEDFLLQTSNVNFYQSNYAADFFINIRGQTSIRGSEPSVTIVVDGVQLGNQTEFNTALFDLQQIEVLKGPQGALYGRNASAGAVVITTKEPENELSGQVSAGYGNWNSYFVNGSVGGALIDDKLKVRLAGSVTSTDGPFTNINTGEKVHRYREALGRLRVDWRPSEGIHFDLRVSGGTATGGALAFTPKLAGSTVGGVAVTDIDTNSNFYDIPYVSDVAGRYDRGLFSASLRGEIDIGNLTLTSITAWSQSIDNLGGKNFPYGNPQDRTTDFGIFGPIFGDLTQNYRIANYQFNQELRLTSTGDDRLRWQIGLQYLDSRRTYLTTNSLNGAIPASIPTSALAGFNGFDATGQRVLIGGGFTPPSDPYRLLGRDSATPSVSFFQDNNYGENISPFANAQFDITEHLELGLAGRYDIERRRTSAPGPDVANPFLGGASYNPCVRITGQTAAQCREGVSRTFKQFQPKATLTYKFPSGNGSIFASWGKSFKTGGFNPIGTRETLVQSRIPLVRQPGDTDAQARVRAEAAVLTQDFYDKEVSDSYEIGFKAQLFDRKVNVSGAIFHTETTNAQQYRFDPIAFIQAVDAVDRVENKGFEFDINIRPTETLTLFGGFGYVDSKIKRLLADPTIEGNIFPYASKYNATIGAQLDQPLNDSLRLSARGEYNITGPIWWDVQNTATTRRDAIGLMNARLGLVHDRWELTAWSRNLFDKEYSSEAVVLLPFLNVLYKAPGRSFGIEGKVRF